MKIKFTLAALLLLSLKQQAQINGIKVEPAGELDMSTMHGAVNSNQKTMTGSISDTLYYFFNKHHFRNTPAMQGFYTVKSPAPTSTLNLAEFGASFLNGTVVNNTPVTLNAVRFVASRQANSVSSSIPVRVYVYNANPAGLPGAKVDSAMAVVTNTGGAFYTATFITPKTFTNSFFVSYKPMPSNPADTLKAWITNSSVGTTTASVNNGEGLGYTRIIAGTSTNSLYVNTNLYGASGSVPSDPEPIVAPIVSFNFASSFSMSPATSTAIPGAYCTNTLIMYNNTTTGTSVLENRQFNYNKFVPYWKPFSYSVQPVAADSIYSWNFTMPQVGTYYSKNFSQTYTVTGNTSGSLLVRYKHGSGNTSQNTNDLSNQTYSVVSCGSTGLTENLMNAQAFVFPNPNNGSLNIKNLEGKNTLTVYNLIGQEVFKTTTEDSSVNIDVAKEPSGNYLLKITNANGSSRVMKLIKN
ncbi:MAG: T9SS type A sorting domain-containing protein [Bacteroidetes bacterium]|nr:T9SS type A sorting domain-containing protein [Bacteroidota bacterium]